MAFGNDIIEWYARNKRDLPWRHTTDPYLIWVSEVILQQTRVEQGLPYYERFVDKFPDIEALSAAEEDEVMKIWQGLGYYSRARNMHRSAKEIHEESQSKFPASYAEIKKMHGVGDYSASAIASLAYGEPCPVVDGNVLRVISRYSGIKDPVNSTTGKKKVKEILLGLIDPARPGEFNQAMIEVGALVCKPRQPRCPECPLQQNCYAYQNGLTGELPVIKKQAVPKTRYFNYLVIISRNDKQSFIMLNKRTANDIWKNLYDFPLIETDREISLKNLRKTKEWKRMTGKIEYSILNEEEEILHILSHQELRIKFIILSANQYQDADYLKVNVLDIKKYPVPRPIENFLKKVASRPGIFLNFPD